MRKLRDSQLVLAHELPGDHLEAASLTAQVRDFDSVARSEPRELGKGAFDAVVVHVSSENGRAGSTGNGAGLVPHHATSECGDQQLSICADVGALDSRINFTARDPNACGNRQSLPLKAAKVGSVRTNCVATRRVSRSRWRRRCWRHGTDGIRGDSGR